MSDENSPPQSNQADTCSEGEDVVSATKEPGGTSVELELLEKVEETARRVAVSVVKHEMHSGPMPAPKHTREYDAALPGTALIIRDEFQANGKHVRDSEQRALEATIEDNKQNRRTAERLVWGSLALILVLALADHERVAIAISLTTVAAVITGFLKKRTSKPSTETQESDE